MKKPMGRARHGPAQNATTLWIILSAAEHSSWAHSQPCHGYRKIISDTLDGLETLLLTDRPSMDIGAIVHTISMNGQNRASLSPRVNTHSDTIPIPLRIKVRDEIWGWYSIPQRYSRLRTYLTRMLRSNPQKNELKGNKGSRRMHQQCFYKLTNYNDRNIVCERAWNGACCRVDQSMIESQIRANVPMRSGHEIKYGSLRPHISLIGPG